MITRAVPRRRPASRQHQPQEQLRRDQVAFRRQHELDGLAGRIDRAIQIRPPTCHLYIRFVHAPRPVAMAHLAANALIQNRRIPLDPAPDGHMVHGEVPLRHDFLQIAIGERISQVPANAQQDDQIFEMPSTEQCRPPSGHDIPIRSALPRLQQNPFDRCRPMRSLTWNATMRLQLA